MHFFHLNGSSPIQKYQEKKEKKEMAWLYQENKRKRQAKGELKEVKLILNIIQRSLLKQSSHHLFGPLLSFTSILLALATIQA